MKKLLFIFIFNMGLIAQTVTDYDGNVYNTITVGSQVWMKENLRVKHYCNGDTILEVRDSISWVNVQSGAWCYFNNNINNGEIYGCLYNGYAVSDKWNIAPTGWHIPTEAEWQTLEMFLGMSQKQVDSIGWRGEDQQVGAKLKEADTIHWKWPTGNNATNSTDFTALGSGWRNHFNPQGYPSFINLTNTGQWWSSTASGGNLWFRNLCVYHGNSYRDNYPKNHGCAVRCIKDYTSGINVNYNNSVTEFYPNPASDYLIISGVEGEAEIINTFGISLWKGIIVSMQRIDVTNLENGIYFLKAKNSIQKFMVVR